MAANQRRPYCAFVNSHSSVGLVSRQWDAVDWASVLCDRRIHKAQASRSASSPQCACPFHSSRAEFLDLASHHPGTSASLQPRFGSLWLLAFPKVKIAVEREEICECDGHTVHKVNQRRLTADWLAPRESDCSRIHSKVSSDWLPSYIKTTQPVLEILEMAGYFPESHRILSALGVPWGWRWQSLTRWCIWIQWRGCYRPERTLKNNVAANTWKLITTLRRGYFIRPKSK